MLMNGPGNHNCRSQAVIAHNTHDSHATMQSQPGSLLLSARNNASRALPAASSTMHMYAQLTLLMLLALTAGALLSLGGQVQRRCLSLACLLSAADPACVRRAAV